MESTMVVRRPRWRAAWVGVLAIGMVGLLLVPSPAASDPISDRIAAAFERVTATLNRIGNGNGFGNGVALTPPANAGPPSFLCQVLIQRVPPFVRDLLLSLGVGPCASP